MNKKQLSFLYSKINENKCCLLHAIEDLTGVEFYMYDEEVVGFEIVNIYYAEQQSYKRKDYQLEIIITTLNNTYIIKDWFSYNKITKEFELTLNYVLQFE